MESLRELFVEQLQDIYSAEKQLVKALPKMAKAASSSDLRAGFEEHLAQTRGHLERLDTIFENIGEKPGSKTCKGMAGLIAEGTEHISEDMDDDVKDACLIADAQRIEHYEIAAYGTVRSFATRLNEERSVTLLEQTLEEEKETDAKLTDLSEGINLQADAGMDEEKPRRKSASSGQKPMPRNANAAARRKRR